MRPSNEPTGARGALPSCGTIGVFTGHNGGGCRDSDSRGLAPNTLSNTAAPRSPPAATVHGLLDPAKGVAAELNGLRGSAPLDREALRELTLLLQQPRSRRGRPQPRPVHDKRLPRARHATANQKPAPTGRVMTWWPAAAGSAATQPDAPVSRRPRHLRGSTSLQGRPATRWVGNPYAPAPVNGASGRSGSGTGDGCVMEEGTGAPVAGPGTAWAMPRSSLTHLAGRP